MISAIALEYGKRQAPSILTKGEGDEYMSIIDAAFDQDWSSNEALQRLLSGVDIGEEIPESLYRAVAVVLAGFWLRGMSPIVMMGNLSVKRLLACPGHNPLDLAQLVTGFPRVC